MKKKSYCTDDDPDHIRAIIEERRKQNWEWAKHVYPESKGYTIEPYNPEEGGEEEEERRRRS